MFIVYTTKVKMQRLVLQDQGRTVLVCSRCFGGFANDTLRPGQDVCS